MILLDNPINISSHSLYKNQKGFFALSIIAALLVVVLVAFVGYKFLSTSHASPIASVLSTNIQVRHSTVGNTGIPTKGLYWGGVNQHDTISTPGCESQTGFSLLECKVAWSGKKQNLLADSRNVTTYHSSMQHFYVDCSNPISNQIKDSSDQSGRQVLLVSMKCGDWGTLMNGNVAQINNIKQRTKELAALKIPVILVFHHEPENDSCNAVGKVFGTPPEYRGAFRQFSNAVRTQAAHEGVNRIAIGWTLMGFTFDKNGHGLWTGSCKGHTRHDDVLRNPANWYPGDDAVDWLLPDIYDSNGNKSFDEMVSGFELWVKNCPDKAPNVNYSCSNARNNKPIGFAETSVQGSVAHRAAYFGQMATALPKYPNFKAYAFWSNKDIKPSSTFDGTIDRSDDPQHLVLSAYAEVELSPYVRDITY